MKRKLLVFLTMITPMLFAGCISEESDYEQATLNLLHSEVLENGNVVDFLEVSLEPGLILVSERGSVPNVPATNDLVQDWTVTEIFNHIAPGVSTPEVLLQASEREVDFRNSNTISKINFDVAKTVADETLNLEDLYGENDTEKNLYASGSCSWSWFRDRICTPIWAVHGEPAWKYENRGTYSSKYMKNIYYRAAASVCGDIKNTRFVFEARKAWSWKLVYDKIVKQGTWHRVRYYCDTNNHDFYSKAIPLVGGTRYHHCGGGHDR
ncbi:MAG: hypothetical protein GY854_02465 [Deltaproteobacteria bacterium]|nr:hypothetical protein [Deltaproteobacteria bacterium]